MSELEVLLTASIELAKERHALKAAHDEIALLRAHVRILELKLERRDRLSDPVPEPHA